MNTRTIRLWMAVATVLLLAAPCLRSVAEPVSADMAALAVNTLIAQNDQLECPVKGKVSSVRLRKADNGASFYVAKLSGGGFVVTSTDTEIDPIVVISTEKDLVADSRNPLWALIVGDMAARKEAVEAEARSLQSIKSASSGKPSVSEASARWARLTSPGAAPSSAGPTLLAAGAGDATGAGRSTLSDVRVAPLLKTKWGQDNVAGKPCFNYYTPNHYLCGCTATAGAQLMRYHKFPKAAVTPHKFLCNVDNNPMLLKQKGGTYAWDSMPEVPKGSMTTAQRKAIGKLTYDIGVAVNDRYTRVSTWGYLSRVVDLCHEWGYAHATSYSDCGNITKAHLKSVIIPNLEAKLPVGVRIYGPTKGGHFVVADGYGYLDKLFSVHLNFGWDGDSDAWYVLPGKTTAGYTALDELAGNIYPKGPKRGGIVTGRVLSASTSKPVSGLVVTATNCYGMVVRTKTDAKGVYSFILPSSEDDSYWPEGYWDEDEDDDDDEDDYYDDEYGYELPYRPRSHVDFEDVDSRNNDYGWDDEEGGKWVIWVGNTSPESHILPIWDAKNYYDKNFSVRIRTVKFNPNGGSGGVVSRTCNVLGKLPGTSRTGYTFAGWFTAQNGGTQVTETTEPTGNVTYYAHWVANPYTIEFNSNGGSGTMEPMELVYDETKALSPNAFAKGDAGFVGWSLRPNRLVRFSDGESVCNLTAVSNGLVRLYAFWEGETVDADSGEYFHATLAELGYDVPEDGQTPYSVKAYGLPSGLKLVGSKAVTKKDKKGKTVVVKPANVEWWIEGVPTSAIDYATNPPYLSITVNGVTETLPLLLQTPAQDVGDLGVLKLGETVNAPKWLAGVGAGWTVSGLPTGLKYTSKVIYKDPKAKSKVVQYPAYTVYGKTRAAGLFTITAKKKNGSYSETKKYRVLVSPKAVDKTLFGEVLTNVTTMAYVPVDWNLATGENAAPGGCALPSVPTVAKVSGLPSGLTFAATDVYGYKDSKNKTGEYLKQAAQTIVGTPKKPGTYAVTFTRNVTTGTGKDKKTVAKTAQILWTVVVNDSPLELAFNSAGGVIESGMVGLNYGNLMPFAATDGAKVTASGMPTGVTLADLGGGNYAFTGFAAKTGVYLVTVTATLNGNSVRQRVALKISALPAYAKGSFTGAATVDNYYVVGLAAVSVGSTGAISGKFQDNGTNWTFSAASYTGIEDGVFVCSNLVASYSWKVGKTTKKATRPFALHVDQLAIDEDNADSAVLGHALLEEIVPEEGPEPVDIVAWQNLWGSKYKAIGEALFRANAKTAYRTWSSVEAMGLGEYDTLSMKVTTAGAVTATLKHFKGTFDAKTKKPQYATYTCATTLIPRTSAEAGAEAFKAGVPVFFPATGYFAQIEFPFSGRDVPVPVQE